MRDAFRLKEEKGRRLLRAFDPSVRVALGTAEGFLLSFSSLLLAEHPDTGTAVGAGA